MNALHSRLARLIIKSKKYNKTRWEKMLRFSDINEQMARAHFPDKNPVLYNYYSEMTLEYRKRAAWYLKKLAENGQKPL